MPYNLCVADCATGVRSFLAAKLIYKGARRGAYNFSSLARFAAYGLLGFARKIVHWI